MPPSDDSRPEERSPGAILSPPPHPPSPLPPAAPPPGLPGPAGQPPAPPGRPPRARRPPATRTCQHRATAALFLAMLSLFGLLAISNFSRGISIVAFTLLAGVVAAWFSATAIGRARHHGTALPRGSVTALVIASIGMAISIILLAGFALLGKQLTAYSRCLTAANTLAAQQACQHQFANSLPGALNGLRVASRR